MSVEPIGILLALAGLYAVVAGVGVGIYLLSLCTILGAAAALVLPGLGGASIQPSHFMLGFLALAVLLWPPTLTAAVSSLRYPGPGFWFALFVLYSVLTALFLPRIFAGATLVYSLSRTDELHQIVSSPLAPTTSNVTQSVYLIGSLFSFAAVAGFSRLGGMRLVAQALIATSVVCIVFAIADLATYATGTAELLSFFRNANYRMLDSGHIEGFKRI